MNKIFNRRILAVLIAVIALLSVNLVLAKDYSVTAGNWKVDFRSNDTLYTEVREESNFMSVWVKEDPGMISTRSGSIQLMKYDNPTPFGQDALKGWMSLYMSSMNETPIMSDYSIDSTDAVVAEGWNTTFGRMVYGAIYPLDKNTYGSAQKSVGFLSLLDRKTNFEILDSLHVEYVDSPQTPKTPVTTTTNIEHVESSQVTQTPAISQAVGTRENPIPMGTSMTISDGWTVTVLSVTPDATRAILQENQFNDQPGPGNQFFMARVRASYSGSGSDTFGGSYRLRAVGPSSVGYSTFENSAGVIPDPLPGSELFTGGSIEGNIAWQIKSSDANSLVMYDASTSDAGRLYMALYGGQTVQTSTSATSGTNWEYRGTGKMGRN